MRSNYLVLIYVLNRILTELISSSEDRSPPESAGLKLTSGHIYHRENSMETKVQISPSQKRKQELESERNVSSVAKTTPQPPVSSPDVRTSLLLQLSAKGQKFM